MRAPSSLKQKRNKPHRPFEYLVLKEPAVDGAVRKRRALGAGEADELGQALEVAKIDGQRVVFALPNKPRYKEILT